MLNITQNRGSKCILRYVSNNAHHQHKLILPSLLDPRAGPSENGLEKISKPDPSPVVDSGEPKSSFLNGSTFLPSN